MGQFIRSMCGIVVLLAMLAGNVRAQSPEIGEIIENVAFLSYQQDGKTVTVVTDPASFAVEAIRTPSSISFFRSAPAAPDAFSVNIAETWFSPSSSTSGPFESYDRAFPFKGGTHDAALNRVTADVMVIPTDRFHAGDVTIIRVTDAGQNGNPVVREKVVTEVVSSTGDWIMVQLVESGPDTGEFWAYVLTNKNDPDPTDPEVSVKPSEKITATYRDAFDRTEVSQSTALVDPNGRLFDSTTGALLSGIRVSIVDALTGEPGEVYGNDGLSRYPSEVVTGGVVTDESGEVYDLTDGEFLFPLMPPGRYRIEFEPPPGYSLPSLATNFDGLANSPFVISEASYSLEFNLDGTGPITFDVPMDPTSEVTLEKTVGASTAAIGDFVPYTISITNAEDSGARLVIRDTPPPGFRVIRSSIKLDGQPLADDQVRLTGRRFEVLPSVIPPGQTVQLDYVMEVAAGAKNGLNRNRAIALDGYDQPVSNGAEASVFVYEDLLRSTSTITGRVTEGVCGPRLEASEEPNGIEGVRIYLETGEYVITDENGFYHFEQVTPGTHIVRLDDGVLPKGVAPMTCGGPDTENSRFVDLLGGVVWQTNFKLQRSEIVQETERVVFNDSVEHKRFDQAWLDAQEPGTRWIYPDPGRTPSTNSINIGIQHAPDQRVELLLNGAPLITDNFAGMQVSTNGRMAISRWRSVDIEDGRNTVTARIVGKNGLVVTSLNEEIWYISNVTRARILENESTLIADGQNEPEIAVKFTDDGGRAPHAGRMVSVNVEPPFQLATSGDIGTDLGIAASLADSGGVAIGPDGVAYVRLEPTLESGIVTLRIELDNGRVERLRTYVKAVPRPWIVVGMAEIGIGSGAPLADGSGGDGEVNDLGLRQRLDPIVDGRIAVYGKGEVGDGWQATFAVDTSKRRGEYDRGFNREIDPSAAYNLFGDKSYQQQDAPSRYPFYGKLEKDRFQALFGDYNTDLQETELSRYSRDLSGLKIVQDEERYGYSIFAAETNQSFNTDELAADGTSGPYQLSVAPILGQSETITIETRGRLRPDQIINQRVLTRYLDYDLDYRTGLLVFRSPVSATDASLNPNVIVVDYETSEESERHITAGGRASARFADGRLEVGTTVIHEGGSTTEAGQESNLIGVDMTLEISESTELRAEYANTQTNREAAPDTSGDALFVELIHQTDDLAVSAYLREENTGFGLGQTRSNTEDIRRVGANGSYLLSQTDTGETGERTTRNLIGEIALEENLSTGERRETAAIGLQQAAETLKLDGGLRYASEELSDGEERQSLLLTGGIEKRFVDHGLALSVRHEQLLDQQNQTTQFPQRTILGADKTLTEHTILTARHEILNGANASGQNSIIGVIMQPWTGAEVRTELDHAMTESSRRLGAVFGVDQTILINENWTASLGLARRTNIDGDGDPQDPLADDADGPLQTAPSSILTGNTEFTSAYIGAAYRTDTMAVSSRVEVRDSQLGSRYAFVASAARQVTEALSFAAATRAERDNIEEAEDTEKLDIRVAGAYRPRGDGPIVFNRLDLKVDRRGDSFSSERIVNNAAVSYDFDRMGQGSLFLGTKYQQTDIGDDSYSGWTHLIGGQYRTQITDKIDVGVSASALYSQQSGTMEYAYGPSIGYKPKKDIWVSVGWNLDGFKDDDFEAAEYSRDGPYIKMRVKFDENTISGLVDRVIPR